MRVVDAARLMRASAEAARGLFDKEISGFSIDSRAVRPGELFFALSPEDYRRHCFTATSFADAHRFIPAALTEGGAVAAVARAARVARSSSFRRAARPFSPARPSASSSAGATEGIFDF